MAIFQDFEGGLDAGYDTGLGIVASISNVSDKIRGIATGQTTPVLYQDPVVMQTTTPHNDAINIALAVAAVAVLYLIAKG